MHFFCGEKSMNSRSIGTEIRNRRRMLKVTQEDLAEIAGVSVRSIKAIEKGDANPTVGLLQQVLEPVGLTLTATERIRHE